MFEDVIKELKKLEEPINVGFPLTPDEKGFTDRECPREECRYVFKVKKEDWTNIFKNEAVYCPRCREEAPADHWWTTEQLEEARRQARDYMTTKVHRAIHSGLSMGAEEFNRRQPRNSFIKLSLSITNRRPSNPVIVPLRARDAMEQEIQCEECSARFAVIGCAYFCPACGHNSVERTFDVSLNKAEGKLHNINTIRSALEAAGLEDEAENTSWSLIESCFSDCISAFQRLAGQLYIKMPDNPPPPRNAFQKLQQGSELWRSAIGQGYDDWLTPLELDRLNVLFQRRHLLEHTEGIVDQLYIDRSRDGSYRIGQRIVVTENDARQMLALVRKLADALRNRLRELG